VLSSEVTRRESLLPTPLKPGAPAVVSVHGIPGKERFPGDFPGRERHGGESVRGVDADLRSISRSGSTCW